MDNGLWSGTKSRQILKRVVVEGSLVLQTPVHFGSGDEEGSVIPLIVDETSGRPLLTGASIAGALRSYLGTLEIGYGERQTNTSLATKLFGGIREDDTGPQSALIVDDALGVGEGSQVELRDGVKINSQSRTAEENKLYTFMVWSAGTIFNLRFELVITEKNSETELRQALANALYGLQSGQITLGARKHRGFGKGAVTNWYMREFDLTNPAGLLAWVKEGDKELSRNSLDATVSDSDIFKLLNTMPLADQRSKFAISGHFAFDSSILIRSASSVADMAHLTSRGKAVVSGTSLAGAIRARAAKIAQTLAVSDNQALIDGMFGVYGESTEKKLTASRVTVEECQISGGEEVHWVQSRVAIDRFTGGALDTALFSQQPQFGGEVEINLVLCNPQPREIGLLLLVLKDLWTGDLPLGGESSVGRGRLTGLSAILTYQEWKLELGKTNDGSMSISDYGKETLEHYLAELIENPPQEVVTK